MAKTIKDYTFCSTYRNRSIYINSDPNKEYEYAASIMEGRSTEDVLTVFAHSFTEIREQMDEILGLKKPIDIIDKLKTAASGMQYIESLLQFAVVEIEDLRTDVYELNRQIKELDG